MDTDRIDVDKIEDITSLYDLLDIHALELQQKHKIDNLWYKYRDKTQSDIEKQKSQWEVEVFIFSILGGRIFSFSTSNGKNIGEIIQYPVLDEFQIEAFEYIKLRAKSTKSSALSARYNHILWKGLIAKDRSYGLLAIENYIKTIYDYYDLFLIQNENSTLHQIGKLYENTLVLVNELKYYIDEFKDLTNFLLHNEKLKFYVKHGVISDMLQFPKIFKSKDFNNILKLFDDYISNNENEDNDFNLAELYLPNAVKIAQKTGVDVKKWHNEIGLSYLRIADRETREGAEWIKLEHYANAIHAFTQAGNIESKENTEQLYFELKPHVKLNTIKLNLDDDGIKELQQLNQEIKQKADVLLKQNPLYVYAFLAKGKILPNNIEVSASSEKNKDPLLLLGRQIKLDRNKNIKKRKNDKEDELSRIYETYGIRVDIDLLAYLHFVLVPGIKSGHLTYTNLIQYLVQHTWIGIPYHKTDSGGNIKTTNWVKLLAPSICEYFIQVQAWGESKYYVPSFILCIDSLTLKLEGLFRNYAERLNISTSMGKKGEMQEALLHDLLDNDIIKSTINEDDRLLFNYVFSNNGGRNLRNNVAHSFYTDTEYDNNKMLLLLVTLLRLSSYSIEPKK